MTEVAVTPGDVASGYRFIDLSLRFIRDVPLEVAALYTRSDTHGYRFTPGDLVLRNLKDWLKREEITFDQIGVYLAYCRYRPSRFHRQIRSTKFTSIEEMLIAILEQIVLHRVRTEYPPPDQP